MYGENMLTKEQKKANEQYFRNVLSMMAEGGVYAYPHISEVYTVKEGVFYGTKRGVREMRKVTPKDFHSKVQVKEKGSE